MWSIGLAVLMLVQRGSAAKPATHIGGTLEAARFDAASGQVLLGPVRGTVRCNDVSTTARLDGAYLLTLPTAASYDCFVAAPGYVGRWLSIASVSRDIQIDFAREDTRDCTSVVDLDHVACEALREPAGVLAGIVTSEHGAPLASTNVHCWSVDEARRQDGRVESLVFDIVTDASGRYRLDRLPPGPYACYAGRDDRLRQVAVAPRASLTLDLRICTLRCPPLTFRHPETQHDPPVVMHTFTAYLIFWLPLGQRYERHGSDARFESLMAQYFRDIGGTPFYNIVTQYWDYRSPIRNEVALGGTYVDATPYPHTGTRADPLYDVDIRATIERAIGVNGWSVDDDTAFFVFTGAGVQECESYWPGASCTFGPPRSSYAGYHFSYESPFGATRYAYIFDAGFGVGVSPNRDAVADYVLDIVSHEHFETATDPLASHGWYDGSVAGEIGDKCESAWGWFRADGSNVTLGHGHHYVLQAEWSNAAGGCAFAF